MTERTGNRAPAYLLAAVLIGTGQIISYGRFDLHALILVTLGVGAGLWVALGGARGMGSMSTVMLVLSVEALVLTAMVHAPLTYCSVPAWFRAYPLALLLAALLVGSYLVPWIERQRALAGARFLTLLAIAIAARVSVPLVSPQPGEDVWWVQQEAAAGVLHGSDPYRIAYSQIFAPDVYRAFGYHSGFHYPPLSLVPIVVSYLLLHDIRWVYVACELILLGALWILGGSPSSGSGQGMGAARPRQDRELLLWIWGLNTPVLLVLEHSWTEPFGLALLALALVLLRGGRRWPAALCLAALFSYKQYLLLMFPLLLFLPHPVPLLLCFAGITVLSYVPWLLGGGLRPLAASLMEPWRANPRPDGLSFAALWMQLRGTPLPGWLSPLCMLGGLHLAVARIGRNPRGLVGALFTVFATLFLTSKQSFVNYYYLLGFLALVACLLADDRPEP